MRSFLGTGQAEVDEQGAGQIGPAVLPRVVWRKANLWLLLGLNVVKCDYCHCYITTMYAFFIVVFRSGNNRQ